MIFLFQNMEKIIAFDNNRFYYEQISIAEHLTTMFDILGMHSSFVHVD